MNCIVNINISNKNEKKNQIFSIFPREVIPFLMADIDFSYDKWATYFNSLKFRTVETLQTRIWEILKIKKMS